MNQIYVSGPWSFASGVLQVVKSIKAKSKDKVVYSEKGEDYQFSKLEQSNYVVFVLDGLGIYGTEIDDNLNFKGVADDSIFLKGGFTLSDVGNVYLKGEAFVDPLDYLNIEVQPTSYFY